MFFFFFSEKARALHVRARTKDPLALWGDDVSKLCRRIEQAEQLGHFEKRPIGPIGETKPTHFLLNVKLGMKTSVMTHVIVSGCPSG